MASYPPTYSDESQPTTNHATGYRRLADFMGWNPQYAIFPRFLAANALTLLGLQAEIVRIEEELKVVTQLNEADSEKDNQIRKEYQYNWCSLQDGEDGNSRQRQLVLQLRAVLHDYNSALIQQITLNKQPIPTGQDLRTLCDWIENPYGLASGLRGPGSRLWFNTINGELQTADKLLLWPEIGAMDDFTKMMLRFLAKIKWALPFFSVPERFFPASTIAVPNPSPDKDFRRVGTIRRFASAADKLVTVISCLAITVPIIILQHVQSTPIRLSLIVIFSLIISLTLTYMSDASRKEIFAVVAAIAAVQVVFVGTSETRVD